MAVKNLYNLEDNTLITLYPKVMKLEVKNSARSTYTLEKKNFALLYLISISHYEIVHYQEFNEVLEPLGINFKSIKELHKSINKLKKDLSGYEVYKLITQIKNIGYTVSKHWVEPSSITTKKDYLSMRNFFIGLLGAVN